MVCFIKSKLEDKNNTVKQSKGWKTKKTRPHETLTNAYSKVLYRINNIFLTTSAYCGPTFFELIQNTLFMDVEKI